MKQYIGKSAVMAKIEERASKFIQRKRIRPYLENCNISLNLD